jgi:transcriptional regulator with XRE-family HTH domain
MDIVEMEEKYGMNGNKIKDLRRGKGLSLSRLSELTGISKSYLSIIERDLHKNPSLDILEKLASFFQVDVEYLVKREGVAELVPPPAKQPIKTTLKLEIELSKEQISPQKLQQITELIEKLNEDI